MSILVSGSLAYDHIMNFPDSFKNHILPEQIHILNVAFSVESLRRSWGGTAGNIAYTLKMLGADPIIVSALGSDGDEYIRHLETDGIATNYIERDRERLTASAYITTDNEDNQITAFYGGPLERGAEAIQKITDRPTLAFVSPTDKNIMIAHSNACVDRGIPVVFDPGQQTTAFSDLELQKLIGRAQFLIGNDYEMKMLQQRTGWDMAAMLKEVPVIIVTLGEKGSVIITDNGEHIEIAPCPPHSCDDPTGAGDAYRAGFFAAYERGNEWEVCGRAGSVAASFAIETVGTQTHRFSLDEFRARYLSTYGTALPW